MTYLLNVYTLNNLTIFERPIQKGPASSAWEDRRSMTSSVAEHNSAENRDVIRSRQQQSDVTAGAGLSVRDYVLHWCYSKYLQVRPVSQPINQSIVLSIV